MGRARYPVRLSGLEIDYGDGSEPDVVPWVNLSIGNESSARLRMLWPRAAKALFHAPAMSPRVRFRLDVRQFRRAIESGNPNWYWRCKHIDWRVVAAFAAGWPLLAAAGVGTETWHAWGIELRDLAPWETDAIERLATLSEGPFRRTLRMLLMVAFSVLLAVVVYVNRPRRKPKLLGFWTTSAGITTRRIDGQRRLR